MLTDVERIREALQFVPVGGHDERVRVAFMLKSELGEPGRDLWDEWRDGRGDDEATAVWRSVKAAGKLKIGTLFHEAKANGWRDDGASEKPTPEALAERKRIAEEREARDEAEATKRHAEARAHTAELWTAAAPADADHPYLTRKGIEPHGIRVHDGALVVPMRDADGKLHSLQTIAQDGTKRFLPGGKVAGCYYAIGTPAGTICIAEGFATAASIHEATGYAVAVAFNAGNLEAVARALRAKRPDARIILCADDDDRTDGNPGMTKAKAAARAVGGLLAVPDFDAERPDGATDFNDMHRHAGAEAVERAIANASDPAKGKGHADAHDAPAGDSGAWPTPHPLSAKVEPEPYPLDALPDTIRAAVEEVAGFVKAPVPLVTGSALGALSLACQGYVDVQRAEKLHGPAGLFLLTIADSGERKSTCDGFFTKAIRDYQDEQAELAKPVLKEHAAAFAAWNAEREGLLSAVKSAGKAGKPTDKLRGDLVALEKRKPEAPRIPRLLLGDETPENLAWGLAKHWPTAGVLSSEAGIVLGSHGMGRDSVMRNLALLNVLWDGGMHSVGRRTSESFTVRGARLTVGLQVQEATLREFFARSGPLARGTGFLARFLVAWPPSTQGNRPFTEAPAHWPHLAAFHRRMAAILNQPVPIDDDGALTPAMLTFTTDAKAAWVAFHDEIEAGLRSGGELYDVRDVASKAADNAARLAALFQVFEHGTGAVALDCFERASRIAAWHLWESRRFFGELALPAELADAARLDGWLIEYCRRERTHFVSTREAQRLGPIRDKERLTIALRELDELDRVRIDQERRRKTIKVNPALVGIAA